MSPKQFFEQCLKEIAKEKLIIDVGGGHPFQKDMAKYKNWFKNSKYLTIDQTEYKPSIVADIHQLPFESGTVDAAIYKAVLEHVYDPFKVTDEIFRVLKKHGKLLVWLPFLYPYHGAKTYKDYYRYTEDGVKYLFRKFKKLQIVPSKGYFETIMTLIPGLNKIKIFGRGLDHLIKIRHQYSGFYIYATK